MDTEQLVREFGPKITSLCRRMIRDSDRARDTAQEAWVQILKSLPTFEGKSSLSTWIFSITKRCICKSAEKDKKLKTRSLSAYFADHEADGIPEMLEIPLEDRTGWIKLQCSDCINAVLHCLDTESRLVYLMRSLTQFSYDELSGVFGRKSAALRQIFSRASKKINRFLSGNCFLYNPEGTCRCKMKAPIKDFLLTRMNDDILSFSKGLAFLRDIDEFASIEKNWIFSVTNSRLAATK